MCARRILFSRATFCCFLVGDPHRPTNSRCGASACIRERVAQPARAAPVRQLLESAVAVGAQGGRKPPLGGQGAPGGPNRQGAATRRRCLHLWPRFGCHRWADVAVRQLFLMRAAEFTLRASERARPLACCLLCYRPAQQLVCFHTISLLTTESDGIGLHFSRGAHHLLKHFHYVDQLAMHTSQSSNEDWGIWQKDGNVTFQVPIKTPLVVIIIWSEFRKRSYIDLIIMMYFMIGTKYENQPDDIIFWNMI